MPDMVALISKAVFDRDFKNAKLSQTLPMAVYLSANKQLQKLDPLSRLFLVTVRNKNEALWLVAILESPVFNGSYFSAAPNRQPIANISQVRKLLKFESGKGLPKKRGTLAMSLQTPRVLSAQDVHFILNATLPPERPVNLTKHDDTDPLPCLCRHCLPTSEERVHNRLGEFLRAKVEVQDRVLWFWVPIALADRTEEVKRSVLAHLHNRLEPLSETGKGAAADGDDVGDFDEDDNDSDR